MYVDLRRRLGAVLARALLRAWQMTLRRLGVQQPPGGEPRLCAPLRARVGAIGHHSEGEGR